MNTSAGIASGPGTLSDDICFVALATSSSMGEMARAKNNITSTSKLHQNITSCPPLKVTRSRDTVVRPRSRFAIDESKFRL